MTAHQSDLEAIIEVAADYLLIERRDVSALPNHLSLLFPDCPPLELTLCLATLADLSETQLALHAPKGLPLDLWRIASLIAVDVLVMQTLGLPWASSRDLRAYWKVYEPYFLLFEP